MPRTSRTAALFAFLAALTLAAPARAQVPAPKAPPPLSSAAPRIFPRDAFPYMRFEQPMDLRVPLIRGIGRLFVAESGGRIFHFVNERDTRSAKLFLDLRDRVESDKPGHGILGFAFHPRVARNGRLFVLYVGKGPRRVILSEFRITRGSRPPTTDSRKERVWVEVAQELPASGAGAIAFGPDGLLYFGAEMLFSLDVDAGKKTQPQVHAKDLRNLVRISFDRASGKLWSANDEAIQGLTGVRPETLVAGHVYRGTRLPMLREHFLFGDNMTGRIWAYNTALGASTGANAATAFRNAGLKPAPTLLADTDLRITSFGVGHGGELYLTALDGRIYELFENKPQP